MAVLCQAPNQKELIQQVFHILPPPLDLFLGQLDVYFKAS